MAGTIAAATKREQPLDLFLCQCCACYQPPPPAPASAIPDEPPRKRRKHQDDQSLVSDTHGLACGSESKAKDKEEERLILVSSNEPDADIARGFESDDDGTLPRSVEVDHDLDSMLDQDAEVEDSDGSITDFEEEFDMDI
ncbi:hypothetical protein N7493_008233 [Penicillium malachiteum]|uniref:Uncharacterized protein n=1 Tax=Penicillium malachiteum TaxID=1324776 RepID=A0AAD6MTN9_9EURO|nr:hypothetical protein N7493_008233 [Penicillium malachiteum]